jgi:aspartyl-tRNA(Asn)/glutamyl-tRNA(Gln) amidotransferase subunit A
MDTPLNRPLPALATAIRDGALSPVELTEAAIERHETADPDWGAYKTWAPELARAMAGAAETALRSGSSLGPLQGIPVSVKDLFGVGTLPTFAGTPRRLPPEFEREGPVMASLRRQLGVIVGKTHTVEMAFGGLGVNTHWSTPRNPWDAKVHRVPGGSSSGAGVSLWEGSALLALGTDTAGSVRIPASMTGTVGLKTSAGRWSTRGVVPLSQTLDTVGVLARDMRDLAFAFGALDPAHGDGHGFYLRARQRHLPGLRIGLGPESMWRHCQPDIARAVNAALGQIADAGAALVDLDMPEAAEAVDMLWTGSVVAAQCDEFLASELPEWRDLAGPLLKLRIDDGAAISAREFLQRRRALNRLCARALPLFEDVDVIASPTVPITPPPVAEVSDMAGYREPNMAALSNTCPANYLGLCAVTLPVGLDDAGMPVGLQLMAAPNREEALLGAALAVERVLGPPRERIGTPPGL